MTTAALTPEQRAIHARQIQSRHEQAFVDLARAASLGCDVSPEQIAETARLAGATIDEFERILGALRYRRRLREKHAQAEQYKLEYEAVRAKIDAANAELEAAVAAHQRITQPLQAELVKYRREWLDAQSIDAELIRSCPRKDLVELWRRLCNAREHEGNHSRELMAQINELKQLRPNEDDHGRIARRIAALENSLATLPSVADELTKLERQLIEY